MTQGESAAVRHVWVLRHAKAAADSPAGDDHSRPLTKRGRRQAEAAREFLAQARSQGSGVARLVVCSSATRALQTAELVLPALGVDVIFEVERDLYTADADDLIDRLRRIEEGVTSVMVVGHNPALAELVQLLDADTDTAGRARLRSFPTCALAHFALRAGVWAELVAGTGKLEELFVPER